MSKTSSRDKSSRIKCVRPMTRRAHGPIAVPPNRRLGRRPPDKTVADAGFVDPTTSEREYTIAEMEFMMAMNEYKHSSGRMFPTWSEVLEVLRGLGYEKMNEGARCAMWRWCADPPSRRRHAVTTKAVRARHDRPEVVPTRITPG